ncbi:MAG: hypothetical protein Pg6A_12840 [Termitinemataceae bacterium]|nr:MAG: hypothetical protein Pg6A_12840 [Termitinemataceae bacterium]
MKKTRIRIHGDNIVECERTLNLISRAYNTQAEVCSESIYLPTFNLHTNPDTETTVELFGGHDRWGININNELSKYGAPLREAADSYVTLLTDKTEELLFAVEYCGALPAGNNAWQRSGRAANCAEIGIPYLYFAEIGGVELNSEREIKAPRFPNPIVPCEEWDAFLRLDSGIKKAEWIKTQQNKQIWRKKTSVLSMIPSKNYLTN